ncbi:Cuticle protein [Eumeta japonica]|uniref:Cuticle protein n=1 Tax=Eumeta variegata TaxID=151549 RepID=A0A4C1T544_EUMVA|nr:Cuticle protein [Eumeta japonica]
MLRYCAILTIIGGVLAYPAPRAQHQYQQAQPEGVPPHLLRQYITAQQLASNPQTAQVQLRPTHVAPPPAPAPVRLPYVPEPQFQQQQPQYRQQQPQYQQQQQPQYQQQQYQSQRGQEQERQPQEDYDLCMALYHSSNSDEISDKFYGYIIGSGGDKKVHIEAIILKGSFKSALNRGRDRDRNRLIHRMDSVRRNLEPRERDVIKGSYSVVDSDGFIRTVTYTADPKEGFKAEVSRQPTDIVVKIPTPKPQLAQPQLAQTQLAQPQAQPAPQPYYRYQQ